MAEAGFPLPPAGFPLPPGPKSGRPATAVPGGRPAALPARRLTWPAWWRTFAQDWQQGEHLTLIGATGSGKTTLGLRILPARDWTVILATKPADPLLDAIAAAPGWTRTGSWPPPANPPDPPPADADTPPGAGHWYYRPVGADDLTVPAGADLTMPRRVILWPPRASTLSEHTERQRTAAADALDAIFAAGGWTVMVDEALYLTEELRLAQELRVLLTQGRSLGLTIVAATQRPYRVPLELFSQATHLLAFRMSDARDLERLGDLNADDPGAIRRAVAGLAPDQFLHVNTRTGAITVVDRPPPIPHRA